MESAHSDFIEKIQRMNTIIDLMTVSGVIEPTTAPQTVIDTEQQKLGELSKRISESGANVNRFAFITKENFRLAIRSAIETGTDLNKAKDLLQHGEYEKWFTEQNFPFTQETGRLYRGLAEAKDKHVWIMETCQSFREAYQYIGVTKTTPKKTNTTKRKPTVAPEPVVAIAIEENRIDKTKRLVKEIRELFNGVTEDEKESIRIALKPLVIIAKGFYDTDKDLILKLGKDMAKERGKQFQKDMKELTEAIPIAV